MNFYSVSLHGFRQRRGQLFATQCTNSPRCCGKSDGFLPRGHGRPTLRQSQLADSRVAPVSAKRAHRLPVISSRAMPATAHGERDDRR